MCTIILATRAFEGVPLAVAANRDERLDRPAAPPELWTDRDVTLLAPRDLEAGGTWIAVSEAGLFAGITNRFGQAPDATRRSRGELIPLALQARTVTEAASGVAALDAAAYNPFHLMLADRDEAEIVWGDGARMHRVRLDPGLHVLTERSFGAADSPREALLRREVAKVDAPAALPPLLTLRSDDGLNGTLVDVPAWNYGTRSSTLVELRSDGSLSFRHANGPPDTTPYREVGQALEMHA